jgi:2-dehydropantoate 2-reductase
VVAALSNGLDPERVLGEILGRPVPRVIVQLGATLDGPGRISFWGGNLMLGPGAAEDRIAAAFAPGGLVVERTDDLRRVVWQKLAINCVANPLSALTGRCNRELVDPELAGLREAIVAEVRQLAATEGVVLAPDLRERIDAALGRSANRTSMLQDVERGRPTEIEHLNGLVARRLGERGIAAPVNRGLAQLVRMLGSKR